MVWDRSDQPSSDRGYYSVDPLVDRAWQILYNAAAFDNGVVVRPSIPILFFGDSTRYLGSPLKIITVGLNPSRQEFPDSDRFQRFPAMKAISQPFAVDGDRSRYIVALNDYFRIDPYKSWFAAYEAILQGMGASYYDSAENTALHTDVCTPLATDPTWTGLTTDMREGLISEGRALWHDLVRRLAPELILVSVAREHLRQIKFVQVGGWEVVHIVDRANPFEVRGIKVDVVPGKTTSMIFGRAAQTPFGTVSVSDKRKMGAAIRKHYAR
jgi:hypothetical protein